jgi:Domain of unknown function (DUF5069)
MLFSFKGVQAEDVKSLLASGATDEQVAAWLDQNGIPKTADEIKAWSDSVEAIHPYQDPEQRDWFVSECAGLGIDPVKSRLCDYLDTDLASQNSQLNSNGGHHRRRPGFMPMITTPFLCQDFRGRWNTGQ